MHHLSVSWKITPLGFFWSNVLYFAQKEPIKVEFENFECSGQNPTKCWHFWNKKSVFLRVFVPSLVLWDINPLWFFSWNSMYFQQKESLSRHKFGILHFDGFHLSKSYKVSAKEVQKNSLMTLKSDAKFKKNLTCGFKYDMGNLVTFHPTIQKAEQLFWMDCFFPKCRRFELQIYRGVIFHDTEQWHKCE